MVEKIPVKYLVESLKEFKEIEKLYKNFIDEYKIQITEGELIIKKTNSTAIEISPKSGMVSMISSSKDISNLETKLIELKFNKSSIFKTKENRFIIINYQEDKE